MSESIPVVSLALSFRALVMDTLREAMARRMVWGVYGASGVILLFLLFVLEIDIVSGAKATISLFGQEAMSTAEMEQLHQFVAFVQGAIAAFLYAVSALIAVFLCAGLCGTLIDPGRVDVLLARPLPRATILLARYTGAVLIGGGNVLLLVLASWLILGWKSGFWNGAFLYAIPVTCFLIAALMALVMLASILTGNTAVAMIASFLLVVFSPILAQNDLAVRLLPSEFARGIWKAMYLSTPKVFELGALLVSLIGGNTAIRWQPVLSTGIFMAIALGIAVWIFERRDH